MKTYRFLWKDAVFSAVTLLTNPKLMIFGAAAQFGIFFTLAAFCCCDAYQFIS